MEQKKPTITSREDSLYRDPIALVLFGHNARVLDCCISDDFIVTVSEVSTCRIWGIDGEQLQVIREHIGKELQIALFLDNLQYVRQVFISCADVLGKKQFCYILVRHGITFELDEEMVNDDEDREVLRDIINNSKLSEGYLTLARDIEVIEPKSPEDIYKAHLLDGRASVGASVDSARQNLAATFVNAFVNAGFGQDKLMTVACRFFSNINSPDYIMFSRQFKATATKLIFVLELRQKNQWKNQSPFGQRSCSQVS
ncbi:hypothetical protein KIW84_055632 [Lathyrus oleraceus]|uniref:RPN1 N-terminal domain-containing protein n=1 Tax=Pisum sativum TaxID=3888 RepID=A0A9D4WXA2_PEA|nr:hypothetical protein KIW84_055632 [Pisum sativum]